MAIKRRYAPVSHKPHELPCNTETLTRNLQDHPSQHSLFNDLKIIKILKNEVPGNIWIDLVSSHGWVRTRPLDPPRIQTEEFKQQVAVSFFKRLAAMPRRQGSKNLEGVHFLAHSNPKNI